MDTNTTSAELDTSIASVIDSLHAAHELMGAAYLIAKREGNRDAMQALLTASNEITHCRLGL